MDSSELAPDPLDLACRSADLLLFGRGAPFRIPRSASNPEPRWELGTLPPTCAAYGGGRSQLVAACVVEADAGARVRGRLRFLHLVDRVVEKRAPEGEPGHARRCGLGLTAERPVQTRTRGAHLREIEFEWTLASGGATTHFVFCGSFEIEPARGGRLLTVQQPVHGSVVASAAPVQGVRGLFHVRVVASNDTRDESSSVRRFVSVPRASMIGAHVVLSVCGGAFLSLASPPDRARSAARTAAAANAGTWPALTQEGAAVMAAPMVFEDHPVPPGDGEAVFEPARDHEIVLVRCLDGVSCTVDALEDDETWQRLRRPTRLLRLPASPAVETRRAPAAPRPRVGSRVRLQPRAPHAGVRDALQGCAARVSGVHTEEDGQRYVVVTLEPDAADALHLQPGRELYFAPHEVVPLD